MLINNHTEMEGHTFVYKIHTFHIHKQYASFVHLDFALLKFAVIPWQEDGVEDCSGCNAKVMVVIFKSYMYTASACIHVHQNQTSTISMHGHNDAVPFNLNSTSKICTFLKSLLWVLKW